MTPDEQVAEWVLGNSLHNHDRTYKVVDKAGTVLAVKKLEGGECCPDFSCCRPELKWGEQERRAFGRAVAHGDHKTKDAMLGHALASLLNSSETKVHIAGSAPESGAAIH